VWHTNRKSGRALLIGHKGDGRNSSL
jgi:hypothetical protein